MADLPETSTWEPGIYQFEETDPVHGGPPNIASGQGIDNWPTQQLANRTNWLKDAITALQGGAVSQADIDTAIAALLDGAPDALNTLNELAAALGDNDSELATLITQIAGKMSAANNLSEITDPDAARANIGAGTGVPVGMIFGFHGTVAPAGWLSLDGTPVTALYPELRTHLLGQSGVTVDGNGDPFLVDMRGEFLRGLDVGRGVDAGRVLGTWQADELKAHVHDHTRQGGLLGQHGGVGNSSDAQTTDQTESTGGDETRPRNIAVLWCIKAADVVQTAGMADLSQLLTSIASYAEAVAGVDNTKLMTPQRVQQALAPDFNEYIGNWAMLTPVTFVHGLGATPSRVEAVYVCKVAEQGWVVGDEIPATYDINVGSGLSVGRNATTLTVGPRGGSGMFKDAANYFNINDDTNWAIRVRAWK